MAERNAPDNNTVRETTVRRWQQRWNGNLEVGQWTKRLIPNISRWITCRYRTTDYYITQFLTGHGAFGTYTRRIGKTTDSTCCYWKMEDTPEHTVFVCNRWSVQRTNATNSFGFKINADNFLHSMLQGAAQWNTGFQMVRNIMKIKEEEEGAQQQQRQV